MKPQYIILIVSSIFFLWTGCQKDKNGIDAFLDGQIIQRYYFDPVPNAKVYLLELPTERQGSFTRLSAYDRIDSTIADEEGRFYFEYQGTQTFLYGIYAKADNYFEEEKIAKFRTSSKDTVITELVPKSYIRLYVKDEFPYSDYDSLWLDPGRSPFAENLPVLKASGLDTVLIGEYIPTGSSRNLLIKFWENGLPEFFGEFIYCERFDTCTYYFTF